ncbi:MAG TPA: DUF481 domain-containing protein, partial [Thermoanaerobaculia bacterium]|nr:DUF481 domain-containing protein [Thermoanaerobaculia bacterium]
MARLPLSALPLLFLLSFAAPALAETPPAECPPCPEAVPAEPPPPLLWSGGLGLSLVMTSGNSDVRSFGLDLGVKRLPDPWGFEAGLVATQVEEDGETSAERLFARARAERSFSAAWSVFGGLSAEQDELAGLDRRSLVEAGAIWRAFATERQSLALDFGLTWTDERLVAGPDESAFGGLAGLAYSYRF